MHCTRTVAAVANRVVADIRDRAGLNGINLATSYHAGRFLQPACACSIQTSARDVVERTQTAIQAGATYLHYLVPAARLDWVRAAVDAVKA